MEQITGYLNRVLQLEWTGYFMTEDPASDQP